MVKKIINTFRHCNDNKIIRINKMYSFIPLLLTTDSPRRHNKSWNKYLKEFL